MKDIANQLVLKWARKDPEKPILVTDDFTRLTLDTIALCSMDFRFNSFYQDTMHPFVGAMLNLLSESGNRVNRPTVLTKLMYKTDAQFQESQKIIRGTSANIIKHRRENPSKKHDLLNSMLFGKDPKTGEVMRDELIAAQMSTFLIAGEVFRNWSFHTANIYDQDTRPHPVCSLSSSSVSSRILGHISLLRKRSTRSLAEIQ
jgi:cytochrome P450/NADPH-cytochrome P450 reductase